MATPESPFSLLAPKDRSVVRDSIGNILKSGTLTGEQVGRAAKLLQAFGEAEQRIVLTISGVGVGVPKTGETPFPRFLEHGPDVAHHVVVALPGQLGDFEAAHREHRSFGRQDAGPDL